MKIKSIKKKQAEMTVDIEVADTHSYQFSNGCVSHNTISKLWGVTEGSHLPSMVFYLRNVQFKGSKVDGVWHGADPILINAEAQGFPVRTLYSSYSGSSIVSYPTLPLIGTLQMPTVYTAYDATIKDHFNWLQYLEKHWIGAERGNQISYTIQYDTKQTTQEEFSATWKREFRKVRCVSFLPKLDPKEMGYEYLPEEEVSFERIQEVIAGLGQTAQQTIRTEDLQCLSGACPI